MSGYLKFIISLKPIRLKLRLTWYYVTRIFGLKDSQLAYINGLKAYHEKRALRLISLKDGYVQLNLPDYETTCFIRSKPSSDIKVLMDLFLEEEYKDFLDQILDRIGVSPLTIIDGGANIGLFSMYVLSRYRGDRFFTYAIEPDESNTNVLKRNLQYSSVAGKTFQRALWSDDSYLKFDRNFRDGREWSIAVTSSEAQTDLRGIGLQQIMDHHEGKVIDLLKLDIEGSEKEVLCSNDFKKCAQKIRFILIEVHYEVVTAEEVSAILQENNFVVTVDENLLLGEKKSWESKNEEEHIERHISKD